MPGIGSFISQKLYRTGEVIGLLLNAADSSSRRTLLDCYASLSRPDLYAEEIAVNVKLHGRIFQLRMRRSDLFTLGEIFYEGQYKLKSQLPSSPVIVDAGANIGIASIWFLGRYPGAQVHAFEPAGENFRLLAENLAPLANGRPYRAAIGREDGSAALGLAECAAMHSLMASDVTSGSEIVPVISLAEHMKTHGLKRIDLLKLDVEGSELDDLVGLRDRISDVGVIVGEVHESLVDPHEFYAFLEQHGFQVRWKRYFRNGQAQQVHGFEAAQV